MKKPSMILFDYGDTLLYEPDLDGERGMRAVLECAAENPQNVTAQQLFAVSGQLFFRDCDKVRKLDMEIHNWNMQRLGYELLGLRFEKSPQTLEQIFWDAACPGERQPNILPLLDALREKGIRSGVISNIGFCGETLQNRLNRLLPGNPFEFVIASADYMVRKPDSRLFTLALLKAGLPADEVWFCGDSPRCDVRGAASVGIYPVWYNRNGREESGELPEHLCIKDWAELLAIVKDFA